MCKKLVFFFLTMIPFLSNGSKFVEGFVPHFGSIKSSEVNVRKGPNARYPIEWVYTKKGEPVEILAQFEHWFKIRDFNGEEGWVKSVMITSKKRTGIISPKSKQKEKSSYAILYEKPSKDSSILANIASSRRVKLEECSKNWCKIEVLSVVGWVEKSDIWGAYLNEEFK